METSHFQPISTENTIASTNLFLYKLPSTSVASINQTSGNLQKYPPDMRDGKILGHSHVKLKTDGR